MLFSRKFEPMINPGMGVDDQYNIGSNNLREITFWKGLNVMVYNFEIYKNVIFNTINLLKDNYFDLKF